MCTQLSCMASTDFGYHWFIVHSLCLVNVYLQKMERQRPIWSLALSVGRSHCAAVPASPRYSCTSASWRKPSAGPSRPWMPTVASVGAGGMRRRCCCVMAVIADIICTAWNQQSRWVWSWGSNWHCVSIGSCNLVVLNKQQAITWTNYFQFAIPNNITRPQEINWCRLSLVFQKIPAGDWYCPNCRPKDIMRTPRKARRQSSLRETEDEDDDDEEEDDSSDESSDDDSDSDDSDDSDSDDRWVDCWGSVNFVLSHWGLVTPYGDRDLGQHWHR